MRGGDVWLAGLVGGGREEGKGEVGRIGGMGRNVVRFLVVIAAGDVGSALCIHRGIVVG